MPSTTVDSHDRLPASQAPRGIWASLRDGGRPLGAFLVLALGIKLLVIMAALGDDPLARHPTSDSLYYLERAAGIAGLIDDPLAHEPFHLPPLYPQILARVPGVLEGNFAGVYVIQAVFGAAALLGVFLLARRRARRNLALGATGLTLLYGPLTFFELKLLGDSFACSLLIFALVVTDRLADHFRQRHPNNRPPHPNGATLATSEILWGLLLGVLLGLTTLLRPQVLLLAVALVVWLLVRRARTAAVSSALALSLVLLPSLLHNDSAGAPFTPVSDNGGVNLWLANAGPLSGTFLTYEESFGDIGQQARSARSVAESIAGRELSPGGVSTTLSRAAWDAVAADPAQFLTRLRLRAQASLESFETGIVSVPEVESQLIGPLRILAIPFGVFLALGGAALVILSKRGDATPNSVKETTPATPVFPMLALASLVMLTTLTFFHYSRFRLPLVPLLAISVAWAASSVQTYRPTALRAGLALLTAACLAWISWLPGEHHARTRAIGWTSLAEARLALATPARRQAALLMADEDMVRALESEPKLIRARFQAHHIALGLGRFDEALKHLDAVAEVLPDHPKVLMNRAWLHAWQSSNNRHYDLEAARTLLERLRMESLLDPELAPHVHRLSATVTALEQQEAAER
jgi:tetratricopeptide (TPR) repeat protein